MSVACLLFARAALPRRVAVFRPLSASPPTRQLSAGDRAVRRVQLSRVMVERFAELSGDTNPVHLEPARGGETVVHGALLNGLVSAVMGTRLPGPGCLVVRQTLEFPAVCRSGDLVEVAVWITAARKIISAEFTVTAVRRDVTVMRGTAQLVSPQASTA